MLPSLDMRDLVPEAMDEPGLDPASHAHALRGLARINHVSRSAESIWEALRPSVLAVQPRPLRVLDVACGGGDVAIRLVRRARRERLNLTMAGCDISDTALRAATANARNADVALTLHRLDVVHEGLPLDADYDAAISSLFLHHLPRAAALALLTRLGLTMGTIVVSDLDRTRRGFLAAWIGTRLLSRSPIVRADGPQSVRAALTAAEVRQLATAAGLEGATVRRSWPWRWLLHWRRP